jgi:hypothetical protein
MRTAILAKLSLTAAVGLGVLVGQSTIASAGVTPQGGGTIQVAPHPNIDPSGPVKVGPAVTTSTTMKPLGGVVVHPQPDPPFDPDLPLSVGDDDDCTGPACDIAPAPHPKPCTKLLGCDDLDLGTDPGCTFTHGCPDPSCEEDPHQPRCNLTSDGGTTDGGSTDGGSTDGHGTTGGTTGGHGSRLPHTGVDASLMAALGLGLAGTGVALKRLGRRRTTSES